MKFVGIKFVNLRNSEYLQFSRSTIDIISSYNPALLMVEAKLAAFAANSAAISAQYARDQGSDLTPIIQLADHRRGQAVSGIRVYVGSLLYHYDPLIRAAAQAITNNLNLHGSGIARQNLNAETASIRKLLTDWATKPLLADAIVVLNLGTWLAELQAANTHFGNLYLDRTQELAAKKKPIKMVALRLQGVQLYLSLRNTLGAYYNINNGANPWGHAVKDINALAKQYNTLLASRAAAPKVVDNETAARDYAQHPPEE